MLYQALANRHEAEREDTRSQPVVRMAFLHEDVRRNLENGVGNEEDS